MSQFKTGDIVTCNVDVYQSKKRGEKCKVLGIEVSAHNNALLILENTMTDYGTSPYKAENFSLYQRGKEPKKKETKHMGYERTQYFGIRIAFKDESGILFDNDRVTNMCNGKTEALKQVQDVMAKDETWMILQTVAMLEPEDPRPPIKITEYR